jgi:F-type H+-transporting ATPase subunit b
MDINITLFGQMLTFAVFVWFTMKYVWPPIMKAMQDREKKISDGLAAAERGHRDLELAQHKAVEVLQEARLEASRIIDQANQRAARLVEDSKQVARQEGERLIHTAQSEIDLMANEAKRQLQQQMGSLAISMAEKIVRRDIDASTQKKLLQQIVTEI